MKIEVWVINILNGDDVVLWEKYLNVINFDFLMLYIDYDFVYFSYFVDKNDNIIVWCEEVMGDDVDDYVCVSVCEISKDGIVRKVVEIG